MKIKIMISFLLVIALILSQTIPSLFTIPDFNVIILIIVIILGNNYKNSIICGIFVGLLSALSIRTPNAQIPVLISKVVISQIVYLLVLILKNINKERLINIILFIGLFLDNIIFFILWFWTNGILTNKYNCAILIELITVFIISSIINTVIGTSMMKIINRCIDYNKTYNNL
jgi:hypothetical protein